MRYYLLISPLLLVVFVLDGSVQGRTPAVVDVGAVFTFNSIIGKSARVAMDAAVSDVNADPTILNQTVLRLKMEDIECNALMGVIKTFGVLQEEVVAMIGPQSSTLAHMVSEIVDGLQVPLVSYAATDPTLSALQFPFFLRTVQSDSVQMAAMADLIDFYEWREVIAVFEDNEHGRNGISSLEDELHKKMSKIAYKLRLPSRFDSRDVEDLLNRSKLYGPRVYVVHMSPNPNIKVFTIAHELQMMTKDYVWLATDWLCTSLDSLVPPNRTLLRSLRGVVGLRQYIPLPRRKAFLSRMKKMQQNGLASSGMNSYGIYAYDSVWAVAFAIDKYLKEHGNITFFSSNQLHGIASGKFRVFGGGILLRKKLLQTNFTGLSGPVHFNSERSLAGGSYEIININKATTHRVGYWSNFSGLAVSAPVAWQDQQSRSFLQHQQLQNVTWPGGVTEKPRGWVIAEKEKPLRVGVPNRASFVGFATESLRTHKMEGYCLEIFKEALKIVPYNIPYRFEAFGNGTSNPSYDELAKKVSDNVFDAAVGDIAIVTNRTKVVDFSQPYIATGLVIVVPIDNKTSNVWVFLKPFTVELWCVTAASFVIIAVVIWILEHRVNDDFRGPPKRQLITMFLFSLSTLFKTNQEDTVSPLGRMVMVVWLFLLLVITSSYTASLTSILTVGQLSSSSITGVESLIVSRLPIGYQVGSFAHGYLTETLNIHRSRLVALGSPEAYETALRKGPGDGGVAAIVDELPYVELFLSMQTDFGIVGQPFTRNGWGFAFQRDSPLAIDMSTAILKLSESGMLQEIHDKWFCKAGCPGERRKEAEADQLHISSFWGLYLLCGTFSVTALLVFLVQTLRQFLRYKRAQRKTIQGEQPHTVCLDAVYGFVDFIDRKEEAIRQYFSQNDEMGSVSGVVQNP